MMKDSKAPAPLCEHDDRHFWHRESESVSKEKSSSCPFCAPKAQANEEECESCLDYRRVLQVVACTVAVVDGPIPSKEELDATWDLVNAVLTRNPAPTQPSPNGPQTTFNPDDSLEKLLRQFMKDCQEFELETGLRRKFYGLRDKIKKLFAGQKTLKAQDATQERESIKLLKWTLKEAKDIQKIRKRGFWTVTDSMNDAKRIMDNKLSQIVSNLESVLKRKERES